MHEFFYVASQVIACVFMLAMTVFIVAVLVWTVKEGRRHKARERTKADV